MTVAVGLFAFLFAAGASGGVAAGTVVENDRYRLEVNPLGGRILSLYSKATDFDYAAFAAVSGGLLTESDYSVWKSRGLLAKSVFDVRGSGREGVIEVTARGQTPGANISFLRVEKTFRSENGSTALDIVYRFLNTPAAMGPMAYQPSFDLSLAMSTNDATVFHWAGEDGLHARSNRVGSSLKDRLVRGWFAETDGEGRGCAWVLPEAEVDGVYAWLPGVSGVRLYLRPFSLEAGEEREVAMEFIPFTGLKRVNGAGGGLVGMLEDGVCRIVSARAGEVEVEEVGTAKNAEGAKRGIVFGGVGEMREFRTEATTVVLKRAGREVCRLERSGKRTLASVAPQREPFRMEADLASFTNFPSFGMRPWAKPLAGGPVRVSVVSGLGNQLEVGMLAESFDMECRTIGVLVGAGSPKSLLNPVYAFGDYFGRIGPADLEREVNKVLSWHSDVILLGGVPLEALPESSRRIVEERKAKGTGVVIVGKGGTDGLDWDALPRVGSWMMPGFTPNLQEFYPDHAPAPEYYLQEIAKAVLKAAGRPCAETAEGEVEWTAFNGFREKTATGRGRLPTAAELPPWAGPQTVEYTVRRQGAVVAFGRTELRNEPQASIVSLTPESGDFREDESVEMAIRVKGDVKPYRLRLRRYDANERLLDERTLAAAETMKERVVLSDELLSYSSRVIAELIDGEGRSVSRRQAFLRTCPAEEKRVWDDYQIATCGNSDTRYWLFPYLAAAYRKAMITKVSGQWPVRDYLAPRYNFFTGESVSAGIGREEEPAAFAKTGDKTTLCRKCCLSDPKFFEGRTKSFHLFDRVLPLRGHREFGFGDEQSLTGHEGKPIDFCFSEPCLKAFREFAKARYGTLEKLNAEYESAFASWDEVMPFTRQEVWAGKGRHVAGWADHLEFMDDRVTNSLAFCAAMVRELSPGAYITLSGTQPPAAYSGMDWWKLMHVLSGTQGYGIGGQFDIHRSFRPDGRMTPWAAGYANRGGEAVHRLWESVFHGCQGVVSFWARSQFRPDLTPAPCQTSIQKDLERLGRGVGKYFVSELSFPKGIALYYSQASFRAAFIEERRKMHDALQERVRIVLRELGLPFDYVSSVQLAEGRVDPKAYRTLVLADAVAMGDDEVAALRDYAARGGRVIAFGMPARRTFNCREREASPLAEGFFDGKMKQLLEPSAEIAAERSRLGTILTGFGHAVNPVKVVFRGQPLENARVFTMVDRAGNPCWCVQAGDSVHEGEAEFRFPKEGFVSDLVEGRSYGKVRSVKTRFGRTSPHAFVMLPEAPEVKIAVCGGGRIEIATGTCCTVPIHVRVFRPDGTEAACYAKNLLTVDGKCICGLPFALSDPKGKWKIAVESVFGERVITRAVPR